MTMLTFQADYRAAAVALLTDYRDSVNLDMQIYRARPASLYPPTAFVDRMADRLTSFTAELFQHVISIQVVVVHGLFDSGDAVDQRDRFVDGFLDWSRTRFHQARANSLIGAVSVDDEPNYVPDWLPPERQKAYYASIITFQGDVTD